MPKPEAAPYGSWRSPITSDLIVAQMTMLSDVRLDGDDTFLLEGRPQEQGRNVIVRAAPDGTAADITPAVFNVRVLHLEPIPRRPRPIGCRQPLRHDALKAHAARVPEDRSGVIVGVVAEDDAEPAPAQQPRQALLASAKRQGAEVLAVELEQVERVQHRIADDAAPVERVEDRDAIRAAYHRLAVEPERPGAQQGRGDGDRWVTAAPVGRPLP